MSESRQRQGKGPLYGESETVAEMLRRMGWEKSTQWGRWSTIQDGRFLVHDSAPHYHIAIDEMTESSITLDWIIQVSAKTWVAREDVADLIEAIRELVNPQGTQCSGALIGGRRFR